MWLNPVPHKVALKLKAKLWAQPQVEGVAGVAGGVKYSHANEENWKESSRKRQGWAGQGRAWDTAGTMSSGKLFLYFRCPPKGSLGSRRRRMRKVRPDNVVNILFATPYPARHAFSALIDSKNVIRSEFHLTFDTSPSPPPAPPSLGVLSSLFGKCHCVQYELGRSRASPYQDRDPTWAAYTCM